MRREVTIARRLSCDLNEEGELAMRGARNIESGGGGRNDIREARAA